MLSSIILLNSMRNAIVHIAHVRLVHATPTNANFVSAYRNFFKRQSSQKVEPPYKHICQIGDPVLRHPAKPVPEELINTAEIQLLVDRMKIALAYNTLVGIAAPQIGIPLRVIAMHFSDKALSKYSPEVVKLRQMSLLPLTIFINPQLKVKNFEKNTFVEGCGSVQGYTAEVPRYDEVEVSGYSEKGERIQRTLKGWNARIAQHEIDHLNGQLFVDLMDSKTFMCTCWEAVNQSEGRGYLAFYPKK